jgi:hypothetical protein
LSVLRRVAGGGLRHVVHPLGEIAVGSGRDDGWGRAGYLIRARAGSTAGGRERRGPLRPAIRSSTNAVVGVRGRAFRISARGPGCAPGIWVGAPGGSLTKGGGGPTSDPGGVCSAGCDRRFHRRRPPRFSRCCRRSPPGGAGRDGTVGSGRTPYGVDGRRRGWRTSGNLCPGGPARRPTDGTSGNPPDGMARRCATHTPCREVPAGADVTDIAGQRRAATAVGAEKSDDVVCLAHRDPRHREAWSRTMRTLGGRLNADRITRLPP